MDGAVLVMFLLAALLVPGRPLYAVFYLVAGICLTAAWSVRHGARNLAARRELSDTHIFHGERVTVTLRLQNRTALPLAWCQLEESRPAPLAVGPFAALAALRPGEQATFAYTLEGAQRGRHRVGPLALTAGDPFGLTRVTRKVLPEALVTVYPRVAPLPELGLPARLPLGDLRTRRRLFEDPAWLAGTRPYAPGDSLRRVHWPATARTGHLVVKQFRHAMLLPAAVCLNLRRPEYPAAGLWAQVELAVSAAASLACHLVERQQQVGLLAAAGDPGAATVRDPGAATVRDPGAATVRDPGAAPAGDPGATPAGDPGAPADPGLCVLPLRQGRRAVMDILELLARVQATAAGPPFARTLAEQAARLPRGTLLAVIAPQETAELAAACTRLGRAGYPVLLFVLRGSAGPRPGYRVWRLESRQGEVALQ